MQFPADDCGSGLGDDRRTAPAAPSAAAGATLQSGSPRSNKSPRPASATVPQERRKRLDEDLFSEDARRQYVALKELTTATAITKAQYDRIHAIRWATRHLALAELAERLLRVKRSLGPTPADAHQEIVELIRKCVQQDRARLLKAMQEDPVIVLSRGSVVRWLISVALAGIVLGGGVTYLLAQGQTARRNAGRGVRQRSYG